MQKGEKHMQRMMANLMTAVLCVLMAGCSTSAGKEETEGTALKRIGIIQLMEHTSLNQIHDAVMNELSALGYEDGVNCRIDYENAQGDTNNLTTIVQTMEGNGEDVVIAITTPAAQAAMALSDTTPIVFTAVTDPIAAGLVESLDKTDKNITGTSDAVDVTSIMDLAMEFVPGAKTVGYIYNPGEDNSVSNLKKLQAYCDEKGLSVETAGITSSSELQTAAQTICQKVDIIFVGNDNTVAEAMPVLSNTAIANGIPVFTGADSMVKDGGLATKGIDYTQLGKESADMADMILQGTPVSDIPVRVYAEDLYIYVNTKTADALGIEIPSSVTADAKYVEVN